MGFDIAIRHPAFGFYSRHPLWDFISDLPVPNHLDVSILLSQIRNMANKIGFFLLRYICLFPYILLYGCRYLCII